MNKSASISAEINLIGKTTDEAIALLDKYLDDAYIAHLPSVRIVYRFYFRRILPRIGRLVSRDARAYGYLPESVDDFPYGERFCALLAEAGFAEPRRRVLMGGIATIYTAETRG